MRKLLYLLGTVLILNTTHASAVDSTITITGQVHDNACMVQQAVPIYVDLLTHAAKQFNSVGDSSPMVPFDIVLSPCGSSVTAAKVGFSGTADGINSNLVALNTSSSSAAGMGVQILDGNKVELPLNTPFSGISWIPLMGSQTNVLRFYARIMATQVPVKAGQVSADATFILEFQ